MTVPTSFTTAFVEGVAQLLDAADIGLSWDPDADYGPTRVGIFIGRLPPGTPNQGLALTPYSLDPHPTLTADVDGLNFRYRSGARLSTLWDMRDAVNGYLRGRFPLRLPTGVHISALTRTSGSSLGRDDDNRSMWSDNWTVLLGARHTT